MPTELSQLNDLEAYVKLPGDYPCTKLQMTYKAPLTSNTPAFLLKPEKKRKYESIQVDATMQILEEVIVVPEISEEENEELV